LYNFYGNCFLRLFILERFNDQNQIPIEQTRIPIDERIAMYRMPIDFETSALKVMMSRHFRARSRFQMAARFIISQVDRFLIVQSKYKFDNGILSLFYFTLDAYT
jgi:hypothetical protein